MADFLRFLQAAGPYGAATLCVAMAYALWFMKAALDKMELRALAGEADATKLRDKRAEELREFANAMAEHGEATRDAIRELRETVTRMLERSPTPMGRPR